MLDTRKITLFIVDADAKITQAAKEILEPEGFWVAELEKATQAVKLAARVQVDVLLVDAFLTTMKPKELAHLIAEINPRLRVIFLSHYSKDLLLRYEICPPGASVAAKPLEPAGLIKTVREALLVSPSWAHMARSSGVFSRSELSASDSAAQGEPTLI